MRDYNKFDIVFIKESEFAFPAVVLEITYNVMDDCTWEQEFLLYAQNRLFKAVNLYYYRTFYFHDNNGEIVDTDVDEGESELKITKIISDYCVIPECDKLLA